MAWSASTVHLVMMLDGRGVALGLARNQADERLLHDPTLTDAVGVDSEKPHAAVGPKVSADAGLDS